ncbi:uncharacterized protein DFL_009509 [Arthrobotrys flagrans]|uniref:Chitinase n=1 Tax=Arthrobotrys flagrans TaxID=97331 RepID=A0A436ZSC3_ARTFL|nr:hypothetical protein DFL_009509 [Arthrobotrys flagrans]
MSPLILTLAKRLLRSPTLLAFIPHFALGFDIQGTDNVAPYWGRNSAQISPQPPLKSYRTRPDVDILILSFISLLYSNEKIPILNQATPQSPVPGQGKKVLVSLGGATEQIWDTYLRGGKDGMAVGPFGEVEVDGVDLDLESPPGRKGKYWPIFIDTIRSLYQTLHPILQQASPLGPYNYLDNVCTPTKPSGGFTPLESLLEAASDSMEDCENARVFWKGDMIASNPTNPYNRFGGIASWDASTGIHCCYKTRSSR